MFHARAQGPLLRDLAGADPFGSQKSGSKLRNTQPSSGFPLPPPPSTPNSLFSWVCNHYKATVQGAHTQSWGWGGGQSHPRCKALRIVFCRAPCISPFSALSKHGLMDGWGSTKYGGPLLPSIALQGVVEKKMDQRAKWPPESGRKRETEGSLLLFYQGGSVCSRMLLRISMTIILSLGLRHMYEQKDP